MKLIVVIFLQLMLNKDWIAEGLHFPQSLLHQSISPGTGKDPSFRVVNESCVAVDYGKTFDFQEFDSNMQVSLAKLSHYSGDSKNTIATKNIRSG